MEADKLRQENAELKEKLAGMDQGCEFKKIGLLVPLIGIVAGILVQFFI